MSDTRKEQDERNATATSPDEHHEAGRYEIRLKGLLDARWSAWFGGLSVTHESDGTTILSGPMVDQAALHGVLRKVRDLGLPLLSVRRIESQQTDVTDVPDVNP